MPPPPSFADLLLLSQTLLVTHSESHLSIPFPSSSSIPSICLKENITPSHQKNLNQVKHKAISLVKKNGPLLDQTSSSISLFKSPSSISYDPPQSISSTFTPHLQFTKEKLEPHISQPYSIHTLCDDIEHLNIHKNLDPIYPIGDSDLMGHLDNELENQMFFSIEESKLKTSSDALDLTQWNSIYSWELEKKQWLKSLALIPSIRIPSHLHSSSSSTSFPPSSVNS